MGCYYIDWNVGMSPRSPLWVRVFVGISVGFCAFSAGMLKVSGAGAECGAQAIADTNKNWGPPGRNGQLTHCMDFCGPCCIIEGKEADWCLTLCQLACAGAFGD